MRKPVHFKAVLMLFLLTAFAARSYAQVVACPPNLNFNEGNFNNWSCRTGSVHIGPNGLTYTWTGSSPAETRHTILDASTNDVDPYGGFPIRCPNGSPYTVRLGNSFYDAEAESMSYTYTIPAATTSFSIIFYYAVVFEDPDHTPDEQPRFSARVVDESTGQPLECVSFDFTASAGLPGFQVSTIRTSVLYKDWTPVSLDLSKYAGRTIRIEFMTNDCTRRGHFGYAYIALDPTCTGGISGSILCGDNRSARLVAPYGFGSYTWYSDLSFTTEIGNQQTILITDPPPGSVIPVRVVPFPGFGCEDTMYATITTAPGVAVNAGPDQFACRGETAPIGGPAVPGYSYLWSPAHLVTNPLAAATEGLSVRVGATQFVVRTTDLSSGCIDYDTVVIRTLPVNNESEVLGPLTYCEGEPLHTTLRAAAGLTSVQWHRDGQPVAGAVSRDFRPTQTGIYYAVVRENGCNDTTAQYDFKLLPTPRADFSTIRDQFCINTPVTFANNSSFALADPVTHLWQFSDGNTSSVLSPQMEFDQAGPLQVRLIARAGNGCADTLDKSITLLPRAIPDFDWGIVCDNEPVQFNNLSVDNGATDNLYTWDFGNGSSSMDGIPAPVIYGLSGNYEVRLSATSAGCEDAPITITKTVYIVPTVPVVRYHKVIAVPGEITFLEARDFGSQFRWEPAAMVDNPAIRRPRFTGTESALFTISISHPGACVTVDTLEVVLLKEEGVWMPTAFSPNGDGLNDVVRPFAVGANQITRFSVYNRQGNLIFSSTQQAPVWDGTHQGKLLGPDVFVWSIEYTDPQGRKKVLKGTLTLVR